MEKLAVLFVDNDSSHSNLILVEWCKQQNVFLKFLPRHTTSILQPLDVAVFRKIQEQYNRESINYKLRHDNVSIDEASFVNILKIAIQTLPIDIIIKGFEKSGIYPFCAQKNIDRFVDDLPKKTCRKHSEMNDDAHSSTQITKRPKLIYFGKIIIKL